MRSFLSLAETAMLRLLLMSQVLGGDCWELADGSAAIPLQVLLQDGAVVAIWGILLLREESSDLLLFFDEADLLQALLGLDLLQWRHALGVTTLHHARWLDVLRPSSANSPFF